MLDSKISNGIKYITLSLIVISSFLSARSVYLTKQLYADKSDLYFYAGMILILGFAVSLIFVYIEEKVKNGEKWG